LLPLDSWFASCGTVGLNVKVVEGDDGDGNSVGIVLLDNEGDADPGTDGDDGIETEGDGEAEAADGEAD